MSLLLFIGLIVICCMRNYFFNNKRTKHWYKKLCLFGLICSVVLFVFSAIQMISLLGTLFDYNSAFNSIHGYESTMWNLYEGTMIEAESGYAMCILLTFLYTLCIILSYRSTKSYYIEWKCNSANRSVITDMSVTESHYQEAVQEIPVQETSHKVIVHKPIKIFEAYKNMFKSLSDFQGKSTRSEYWYVVLADLIISFIAFFFAILFSTSYMYTSGGFIIFAYAFFSIIHLVPFLALSVRRLHDVGISGWYMLFGLIPYIGIVILLFFMAQDSKEKDV